MSVKKRILVRAPSSEERIILSFPFFHELQSAMGHEEIHVVVDAEKADAFRFMPAKFKMHHLPADKRGITGIHHFVANLKEVFNVDLFFDLENTFKSAFMGLNFRGRQRVGLGQGPQKLMLNHRVLPSGHNMVDKQYLEILAAVTEKAPQEGRKYTPRDLIEVVEKLLNASEELVPDFVLVLVHSADFDERFPLWASVLSQFEGIGIKMCLLGPSVSRRTTGEERLEAMRSWPALQPIEVIPFEDTSSLVKALVTTKGVLTDSNWAGQLASYFGVDSFVLSKGPEAPRESGHFVQRPKYVQFGPLGQAVQVDVDRELRALSGAAQLMDLIHERFRI